MIFSVFGVIFGIAQAVGAENAPPIYPAPCEMKCVSRQTSHFKYFAEIEGYFKASGIDLVGFLFSKVAENTSYEQQFFVSLKRTQKVPESFVIPSGFKLDHTYFEEELKLFSLIQSNANQEWILPADFKTHIKNTEEMKHFLATEKGELCGIKVFAPQPGNQDPFFVESEHVDRYTANIEKVSLLSSEQQKLGEFSVIDGIARIATARQLANTRLQELRSIGVCRI